MCGVVEPAAVTALREHLQRPQATVDLRLAQAMHAAELDAFRVLVSAYDWWDPYNDSQDWFHDPSLAVVQAFAEAFYRLSGTDRTWVGDEPQDYHSLKDLLAGTIVDGPFKEAAANAVHESEALAWRLVLVVLDRWQGGERFNSSVQAALETAVRSLSDAYGDDPVALPIVDEPSAFDPDVIANSRAVGEMREKTMVQEAMELVEIAAEERKANFVASASLLLMQGEIASGNIPDKIDPGHAVKGAERLYAELEGAGYV